MNSTNDFKELSVEQLQSDLRGLGYISDRGLTTSLLLGMKLGRPLLLEGEVGVGKTELAKTVAKLYGRTLIRLQCYEGIDTNQALYEWDYARQMLQIRSMSNKEVSDSQVNDLFGSQFLIERPLLQAIRAGDQCVLLIDEIDRADDEFESFLLELLSDFQITIPEIGTVAATSRPIVILTSNRTRELHDALKRRCLYNWIGFPDAEQEISIVRSRLPGISDHLATRVASAVHKLRDMDLEKSPGVAETIDWVESLDAIGAKELSESNVLETLGSVIKGRDDLEFVSSNLSEIVYGA
jgi:MoxR-like ATPase